MIQLNEKKPTQFEIMLTKSFDFEHSNDFRSFLKKVFDKNAKKLSINFSEVEYIDSSALGMLMLAKHESDLNQCDLKLTHIKDGHAKDVLHLVKFNQLFTIEEG